MSQAGAGPHWFEDLAEHMGPAYLRYSFTKGTDQEVSFLVDALELRPGDRLLDVGCGPGRHAHVFADRGLEVVGVDISERFIDVANAEARPGSTFVRGDARALAFDSEFDAVVSLCQGAFGLSGPTPAGTDPQNLRADAAVLDGIRRALRPGGRLALSAFSSYFQMRWLEDGDSFDASTGINHEHTEVRDEAGIELAAELWTTCYTPRELRLLVERCGLEIDEILSVDPGRYSRLPPSVETAEFLVLARRGA